MLRQTLSAMFIAFAALCLQSFTLVIDAGHGGKDPGALGRRGKEKNINLAVAKALGQLVESNMPDVKVVYTRKSDVFVELDERARIANRAKADLFVSIHTNALPGRAQGRGSETYTLGMHRAADNLAVAKRENSVITLERDYESRYEGFDPSSAESYIIFELMQDVNMQQSVRLAQLVQRQLRAAGRPDKGVHQAGFLVLRATSMPSCLIELGYITTPAEEDYLLSDAGTRQLAKAIYEAIRQYKN
ncbi:MAG: N-acetylmuramoyl-L-alanine amidase [Bacteroidaceae bacterium]|nr:N-acetylmuramoyl-L-alanine amidase [Bacteroidaceae bacterium]